MGRSRIILSLITLLYAQDVYAKNTRFHEFFPVYRRNFTAIRDNQCLHYY